jgi:ATP-dependent Lhr-like helicase
VQFAHPEAVEQLRAGPSGDERSLMVLATSDPANLWTLPLPLEDASGSLAHLRRAARRRGALVVLRAGEPLLVSDARARSVSVATGQDAGDITTAVAALLEHLAARRARDILVEAIQGEPAATSALVKPFLDAGLRLTPRGLRYYASFTPGNPTPTP